MSSTNTTEKGSEALIVATSPGSPWSRGRSGMAPHRNSGSAAGGQLGTNRGRVRIGRGGASLIRP